MALTAFETKGMAIMTILVLLYKIEIKEEPEFICETFEQCHVHITFYGGLTMV